MTHPDLFPPSQSHSGTSIRAAVEILPQTETLRRRVLDHLKACPNEGCTDEEIQIETGIDANTERPRRVELVRMGLVVDSGKTRQTKSGRWAAVWIAKI